MNNEKINEIKSLDNFFPKGDKRRGEALVLVAEAFLLGKESVQNNTAFTDMSKLSMKPTAQSNNRELMWHQVSSNKELMKRIKEEIKIKKYNERYDAYYDEKKDIWLEEPCQYKDCEFCSNRPTKPSDCKDSNCDVT